MKTLETLIRAILILLVSVPVALAGILLLFLPLKVRWMIIKPINWFWCVSLNFLLGVDVTYEGVEKIPSDYRRGYLVISNHQGMSDIPLLGTKLILPFLMKKEVLKIPFIGIGAAAYGCIPFDRKSQEARQKAAQKVLSQIENDISTITFPEGTRSKDGTLRDKIHPALIKKAWTRGLKVLPCAIIGAHRALDYSGKIPLICPHTPITVKFLEPLNPKEFESEETYAAEAWSRIERAVQETSHPN